MQRRLVLMMAVAAGLGVANDYYALNWMAEGSPDRNSPMLDPDA